MNATTRSVFILFAIALIGCETRGQEVIQPLKATTVMHDDGSRTVTITDLEKRTSEATTYDGSNKIRQRVVYTLDDQNLPASGIVYDPKGRAVFKSTYKHDGANRVSEQLDYTADDKLIRRMVFEYGANNRVSKIRSYDASGAEMPSGRGIPDKKRGAK